jgi:hypothetical protein
MLSEPAQFEMPRWPKLILTELRELKSGMLKRIDGLEADVVNLCGTVEGLQVKVSDQDKAIVNNKNSCTLMLQQNRDLKEEVAGLTEQVNEQIDRSLRCHLTFVGLKRTPVEKSWADTSEFLSDWLASHTEMDSEYYRNNIVRCHRGPTTNDKPPVIECQLSWSAADSVFRQLGSTKTDGVFVRQKFSKATQDRRNKALMRRRELKENIGKDWKMFIRYPATLVAKKPGEARYNSIETF